MLMKKIITILAAGAFLMSGTALAGNELTVKYDGAALAFAEKPIIVKDKTLVQLRPIAEAMELEIGFESGSVTLSDEETTVIFTKDSDKIKVNEEEVLMDVPMVIHKDYTFVPVRDLVEPFGKKIDYDGETRTVTIVSGVDKEDGETKGEEMPETVEEEPKVISTGSGKYKFVHFYQSQPELELEANGRGYCWVCSYAMLFSNASGDVITPLDIAQYNIDAGYSGSFMAGHETLAASFGMELVPALAEDSAYFGEFNSKNRGETTLIITSEDEARFAICEALDNFPYGVIVRFEGYPHSMVAVSYDDENIYFNDPGLANGEHILFEETCLKNYKLSDISYIQAVEVR